MIRKRIVEALHAEFGKPQFGEGYERWVIHTDQRLTALHVVVNTSPWPDRAQVLIFDPAKINGDAAIDVSVRNSGEITDVLARIRRIAAGIPTQRPLR